MTGSGAWRFAAKRTAGAERVRIGHTRTARTHGHAGAREHLPARALAHTCSLAYSPARSRDPSQAHTTHERTDAWKDGRMCHAHTGRQHKCGGARASHVPCTQTHAHLHAAPQHTDARVHACKCSRMYTHACTHVRTHRLTVHFVLKAPRSKHLAGIQTLVRTCATKWPAGTRTGPHLGGLKRCTTRHGPMMLTGLVPSVPLIPQADSHESNSPSMKDFGRVRRPCAMSYR